MSDHASALWRAGPVRSALTVLPALEKLAERQLASPEASERPLNINGSRFDAQRSEGEGETGVKVAIAMVRFRGVSCSETQRTAAGANDICQLCRLFQKQRRCGR